MVVRVVTLEEAQQAFEYWCDCVRKKGLQPLIIEREHALAAALAFFASVDTIREEATRE